MTEFNPNATCIKCGHDDIEGKFKGAWKPCALHITIAEMDGKEVVSKPDRIQRTCTRCGYKWDEAPITSTTFNASDIEPPVIEVGDVLTVGDGDECEHTVLAHPTENWWCISGYDTLFNTANLYDHFNILRKGPNVYEFGTVEIKDDRYMQINTNYPMPPNGNYLLTATEDA